MATTVLAVSCGSGDDLDDGARAELIGAAVARRTLVDSSVSTSFEVVRVVDAIGNSNADGFIRFADDARPLTEAERSAIERALSPAEVTFVSVDTDLLISPDEQSVAAVTIAAPSGGEDGATIATGLVCGGTCGAGGKQRFDRNDDDNWVFAEDVGAQWMS